MKTINIITRTSNRPNYFNDCYQSIYTQDDQTEIEHWITSDDDDTFEYLKNYKNIKIIQLIRPRRKNSNQQPYNKYINEVINIINNDGWILILDDDDIFDKNNSISILKSYMKSVNYDPDHVFIWKTRKNEEIIGFDQNTPNNIDLNLVTNNCFCFNIKHKDIATFNSNPNTFYIVLENLIKKLKPIWIDEVLTKINNIDLVGGNGNRIDKMFNKPKILLKKVINNDNKTSDKNQKLVDVDQKSTDNVEVIPIDKISEFNDTLSNDTNSTIICDVLENNPKQEIQMDDTNEVTNSNSLKNCIDVIELESNNLQENCLKLLELYNKLKQINENLSLKISKYQSDLEIISNQPQPSVNLKPPTIKNTEPSIQNKNNMINNAHILSGNNKLAIIDNTSDDDYFDQNTLDINMIYIIRNNQKDDKSTNDLINLLNSNQYKYQLFELNPNTKFNNILKMIMSDSIKHNYVKIAIIKSIDIIISKKFMTVFKKILKTSRSDANIIFLCNKINNKDNSKLEYNHDDYINLYDDMENKTNADTLNHWKLYGQKENRAPRITIEQSKHIIDNNYGVIINKNGIEALEQMMTQLSKSNNKTSISDNILSDFQKKNGNAFYSIPNIIIPKANNQNKLKTLCNNNGWFVDLFAI